MKKVKITQNHIGTYYETILWDNRISGGWYPFLTGYGSTQENADTDLINKLLKNDAKR